MILPIVLVGVGCAAAIGGLVWWRGRGSSSRAPRAPRQPRVPPAQCWQAAVPALGELGLRQLDAECWNLDQLFIRLELADSAVRGWCDRATTGGMLDAHPRETVTLHPGAPGKTELARWIAAQIGEPFAALPPRATLTVKAPEIAGARHELALTSPLTSPDHVATVARVLLALDAACSRPAPAGAGSNAKLPPGVAHWTAAASALGELGLHRLDAETYTGDKLFVRFELSDASVVGWLDRVAAGVLDAYPRKVLTLHPGATGRSELEQHLLATAVTDAFATLPHRATLTITAPEIPGTKYELRLTSPLGAPEHVTAVARTLLALDTVARGPAPAGAPQAKLPAVVAHWTAAGPELLAMGFQRLDSETYMRGSIFVGLGLAEASVRGWLEQTTPGCILDGFPKQVIELRPGGRGDSEVAQHVARAAQPAMAALPSSARLEIKTPEIAGAETYSVMLLSPLSAPEHAVAAARTLVVLDDMLRSAPR